MQFLPKLGVIHILRNTRPRGGGVSQNITVYYVLGGVEFWKVLRNMWMKPLRIKWSMFDPKKIHKLL